MISILSINPKINVNQQDSIVRPYLVGRFLIEGHCSGFARSYGFTIAFCFTVANFSRTIWKAWGNAMKRLEKIRGMVNERTGSE